MDFKSEHGLIRNETQTAARPFPKGTGAPGRLEASIHRVPKEPPP